MNVLATPEPDALLFARGDHTTFPALYLQVVDGVRPDIVIADKYGYPEPTSYAAMPPEVRQRVGGAKTAIEHWIFSHTTRPIYVAEQRALPEQIGTFEPAGLLYRLVRPGETWKPAPDLWDRYVWHTLDPAETRGNWSAEAIVADTLYAYGRHQLAAGDVAGALASFRGLLAATGEHTADLTNVGASCLQYGRLGEAIGFFDRALRLDPDYVPALRNLATAWTLRGDCGLALPALDALVRLGEASTDEQALRRTCREQGVGG
jgi:tetratricopeptide (TPR) repeat protein